MNLRDQLQKDAIERTIDTAQRILDGKMHPVEGSRLICKLRYNIYSPDPSDHVFDTFIMVKQETHDLPVILKQGSKYESLLRKASHKIEEYTLIMKPVILKACVEIIMKLSDGKPAVSR